MYNVIQIVYIFIAWLVKVKIVESSLKVVNEEKRIVCVVCKKYDGFIHVCIIQKCPYIAGGI